MLLVVKEGARAGAWKYFSRSAVAVEEGGVEIMVMVLLLLLLLEREGKDRRERDETRRRVPGKKKKKDKDAFRRGQPPTTIHHTKTTTGRGPEQGTMQRGMAGSLCAAPRGKEGVVESRSRAGRERIVRCEN